MEDFNKWWESFFLFIQRKGKTTTTKLSNHFQPENLSFRVEKSSEHRMDLTIIP